MTKRILVLFVDNSSGVLTRICLLFSQKGFNILSITCSVTCYPNISRMTIVTEGDEAQISQIVKQTAKLIEIHSVFLLNNENIIERDLLLLKIEAKENNKKSLLDIVDKYGAKIRDEFSGGIITELTDKPEAIDKFLEDISSFKILEQSRTGITAMEKGDKIPTIDL
ncbi:acetolactate synthase small subunit [Brachyspira catarrhinii]|uniref:Acetolactate synthase small subunit n=1 Tax=Brachyspira catarrhinii TaxID=2528966 RepID=A0ABY2TQU5_9SPIR|nr:acetolactate synthase small subunit [Brachyspira catarrhinii]TKZ33456.1 acetolactate synthase small subunit [Brachyspira catarrhinii]